MDIARLNSFMKNRYFYGKLMTVRDFEDEQEYSDEKRHLMNRLIQGSGLLYGLDVTPTSNNITIKGDEKKITITFNKGGVALDSFGNEIVIPVGVTKDVTQAINGEPLTILDIGDNGVYIYLRYTQKQGEMVNAASNTSSCDESCCPNKTIEDFDVVASPDAPNPNLIDYIDLDKFPDIPVLLDRFISYEPVDPNDKTKIANNLDEYKAYAKAAIKQWVQKHIGSYSTQSDFKVFLVCIDKELNPKSDETLDKTSFIYNNMILSKLLTEHIMQAGDDRNVIVTAIDSEGKKKYIVKDSNYVLKDKHVSDLDVYRWNRSVLKIGDVDIDGNEEVTKGIDLTAGEGLKIEYDDDNNKITILNTHATDTSSQVDPNAAPDSLDFDKINKHVSNKYAQQWHSALYSINGRKSRIDIDSTTGRVSFFDTDITIDGDTNLGITVVDESTNTKNKLTIKNNHADGGSAGEPWQVDPYAADDSLDFNTINKHVSNKYAKSWESAIRSINNIKTTATNKNIQLIEGDGITITEEGQTIIINSSISYPTYVDDENNGLLVEVSQDNKTVTIKNIHADGGTFGVPWQVDPDAATPPDQNSPEFIEFAKKNKHLSNYNAKRWESAIRTINEVSARGDDKKFTLEGGGGITIVPSTTKEGTLIISSSVSYPTYVDDENNGLLVEVSQDNKTITVKNIHADGGTFGVPWQVDPDAAIPPDQNSPEFIEFAKKNKHLSNYNASRWESAIRTINGVSATGDNKNFTLAAGTGIDISQEGQTLKITNTGSGVSQRLRAGDPGIEIVYPSSAGDITIYNRHATEPAWQVNPNAADGSQGFDTIDKHVSNKYAKGWETSKNSINSHIDDGENPHATTAAQVNALSINGGTVTGPVQIQYADKTDYALTVNGTTLFTGGKIGYVADIFVNGSEGELKRGDLVKLKGTSVVSYMGDNNLIPISEVVLADKEDDSTLIGIVLGKALPELDPKRDLSIVNKGEQLYVVTLGTFASCKVDTTSSSISIGDILTTSSTSGCAHKIGEWAAPGSIIGKALGSLEQGKVDYIPVFINIQ